MTQQQGELGIERLCELARISRAGYYRYWQHTAPAEVDVELRVSCKIFVWLIGIMAIAESAQSFGSEVFWLITKSCAG
jgi:hypothetical protein